MAENILLGREPRRWGRIDRRAVRGRAAERLARLNLDIVPLTPGSRRGTPIAVQQLVAIARAVDLDAAVLVLDEPTCSLDADEVRELFGVIRGLRDGGVAVVFVTHFLDQVYEVADRITVLRTGAWSVSTAAELPPGEADRENDRPGPGGARATRTGNPPPRPRTPDVPVMASTALGRKGSIAPADCRCSPGEVVGLAGLLGSGRTELARMLFGADHAAPAPTPSTAAGQAPRPMTAIARGIAFCSEDRKARASSAT